MLICGARAGRKTANVLKMSSVLLGPALNSTYFFDHWFTLPLCLMALSSLHTMDTTSLLLALYPAQHMHNALQDHIGRREGSCLCHQENCIQCRADLWHQNQPHRRLTRQEKNIPSWAQTFSPLLYVKSINDDSTSKKRWPGIGQFDLSKPERVLGVSKSLWSVAWLLPARSALDVNLAFWFWWQWCARKWFSNLVPCTICCLSNSFL